VQKERNVVLPSQHAFVQVDHLEEDVGGLLQLVQLEGTALKQLCYIHCNADFPNADCQNVDCQKVDCQNVDCQNVDCQNVDSQNVDCQNANCQQ
jgi:uncharacterized protein YjbI with pentapeptide repeats